MNRIPRTPATAAGLAVLTLIALRVAGLTSVAAPSQQRRVVTVARVLDGDTFDTLEGERIRLLGIDAPEVSHREFKADPFGNESREWLKEMLQDETVQLTFGERRKDIYGRTLAWVWLEESLVNEESLRTGHSRLLADFGLPLKLEPGLREAEATARVTRSGLWK